MNDEDAGAALNALSEAGFDRGDVLGVMHVAVAKHRSFVLFSTLRKDHTQFFKDAPAHAEIGYLDEEHGVLRTGARGRSGEEAALRLLAKILRGDLTPAEM